MKIGIIGAGNVGGTLGTGWAGKGHQVLFGATDPSEDRFRELLARAGPNARAVSVKEAASRSDAVILSVPWNAAENAIRAAGDLGGKILVDVTNPIASGMEGLSKGLVLGHTTSAAERVAAWARGARVVKAFNTTGFQNMQDPAYGPARATMLYCGDDANAKSAVKQLGEDLGFEMIDAGGLAIARLLEPFAMLWIHLAVFQGLGPAFVFQVLRRP